MAASNQAMIASHNVRARLLRKISDSTDLSKTMRKAVRVLAEAGIPSLVIDGYAVQEWGYARFTSDVDLVVPDVQLARNVLSVNGFRENSGSTMTVTDRVSKVEVDLLPAGGSVGPGPLKLPQPGPVSLNPEIVSLEHLIEIKLSSYLGSPLGRAKDLADVVELIKVNRPNREMGDRLNPAVAAEFWRLWDGLKREGSR